MCGWNRRRGSAGALVQGDQRDAGGRNARRPGSARRGVRHAIDGVDRSGHGGGPRQDVLLMWGALPATLPGAPRLVRADTTVGRGGDVRGGPENGREGTMIALVEVRAIVRRERLEHVVRRLKEAAVDAAAPNISLDEGSAYRDMALVQCICAADRCDMLVELITAAAHSGHRGDGIVSVHPVLQVHKIRTKAVGHEALR